MSAEQQFHRIATDIGNQVHTRKRAGLHSSHVLISPDGFSAVRYAGGSYMTRTENRGDFIRGLKAIVTDQVDEPHVLG